MNIKSNEKKENSTVELVIQVSAEEFEAAINKVYNRQRRNIMIPAFRKGPPENGGAHVRRRGVLRGCHRGVLSRRL